MAAQSGMRQDATMRDPITYRDMRPEDAATVAALVRQAFAHQSMPTDPPASALRVTRFDIAHHLTQGAGGVAHLGKAHPGEAQVGEAQLGGALVGSALWIEQDGGLYIGRVAVAPSFRRRGIARHLLAMAETACRRAVLPRLWLETRVALLDNRRLFASAGFVEISRHAHPGYAEPTFVRMEKRLIG